MIRQIIVFSLLTSGAVAACLWSFHQGSSSLGLLLGTVWGCSNLYLIELLLKELLVKKNALTAGGLIAIKFPLLYWAGYKLLAATEANPWYVIGGLTSIFMVALVRALIPMRERLA